MDQKKNASFVQIITTTTTVSFRRALQSSEQYMAGKNKAKSEQSRDRYINYIITSKMQMGEPKENRQK